MGECRRWTIPILAGLVAGALATTASAQETGTIRGAVTFTASGAPVHGAVVLVVGPSLVALTDADGLFEIPDVPVGTHELLAQREHLTAARQTVTVQVGHAVEVDFTLDLTAIHEELTVTATAGRQTTAFEAFDAISTLDSFDLVTNAQGSLGEALQHLPGVANRSFGPGASRPIIRGFDGDRVLLMEDGIRSGDLSSQSGDHGVTIDPNGLERVEIVRGPATLLYGSSAVGGVVNAITPHESQRDSPIPGTHGQFGADTGSANAQVGTNASVQHATDRLLVWAGGGTRRAGDYETPEGTIENSATRLSSGRAGVGYLGDRLFASGGFQIENGRHGVPFADAWATKSVPTMPFNEAVSYTQRLTGQGTLAASETISGFARFTAISPQSGSLIWAALAGAGLVLLCTFGRLRWTWWPLHPVAFLIWTSYPALWFAWSFLIGWILKVLVIRYGGARVFQKLKPLVFGLIAGELVGLLLPIIINMLWFACTGAKLTPFKVLPG